MAPLAPGSTLILPFSAGQVPATILALRDRFALVELCPPDNAPTSLFLLNLVAFLYQPERPPVGRSLDYADLPDFWFQAIVEAGVPWIGRLPEGPPLPTPALLLCQYECAQRLLQFLQEGPGTYLLKALQEDEPWILGWSQGACGVLAEALCFWISDAQGNCPASSVQVRLRFLGHSSTDPFHVLARMREGMQEYLLDAEGIWTPDALLSWHNSVHPACFLDAREEFFSDILRDPARSRAWADQFQRHLGIFPLQAFFPPRGDQSGFSESTLFDLSA